MNRSIGYRVHVLAMGVLAIVAQNAFAGIYDDAAIWIRGFRDLNGDGIVAGGADVPDARQANVSAGCTVYGVADSRVWREETVVCPYGGTTFTAPCCCFDQRLKDDCLNYCGSFGFIESDRIAVTNGVASVVARVRPELGLADNNWLTGGIGFQLGFLKTDDGRLRLYGNISRDGGSAINKSTDFIIEPNTWVDVAMVRDGESVRFYAATNGFSYSKSDSAATLTQIASTFYFGHFQDTKSSGTTKAAYINCFRGSVHQIALWNRALSEAEVREAFAFPRSDVFRVGIVNGSSDEFGCAEPSASVVSPSDWYSVPSVVGKDATVKLAFSVPTALAGFSQCLRLTTTAASQGGSLAVTVDDTVLPDLDAKPSSTALLLVPARLMTAGEHTLSLTRTTEGPTCLDALSLGGSVQVGTEDDSNAEFGRIQDGVPIRSHVEDVNPKNTAQVIEQSKTNEWKVVLPEDVAVRSRWQFEVRAYTGKALTQYTEPLRVAMLVNGRVVKTEAFETRYQTFSVKLPSQSLQTGENTLGFTNLMLPTQSGYYVNLDCVRLMTRGEPKGLMLFFR